MPYVDKNILLFSAKMEKSILLDMEGRKKELFLDCFLILLDH